MNEDVFLDDSTRNDGWYTIMSATIQASEELIRLSIVSGYLSTRKPPSKALCLSQQLSLKTCQSNGQLISLIIQPNDSLICPININLTFYELWRLCCNFLKELALKLY